MPGVFFCNRADLTVRLTLAIARAYTARLLFCSARTPCRAFSGVVLISTPGTGSGALRKSVFAHAAKLFAQTLHFRPQLLELPFACFAVGPELTPEPFA